MLNRSLAVAAVVGVAITMAGTAMTAAEVDVGQMIRVIGLMVLLIVGMVFVGALAANRQIERTKEVRKQQLPRDALDSPAFPLYVRILINAARIFGCIILTLSTLQFCMAFIALVSQGPRFSRYGSRSYTYMFLELLILPIVATALAFVLLCIAEILNRITIISLARPSSPDNDRVENELEKSS